MRYFWALVVTVCGVAVSQPAFSQCTKDTDCKGDRVCDAGSCTTIEGSGANALQALADPGWAKPAATVGYISAGVIIALGIASEATKANSVPSIPLGSSALLVMGITNPIVAVGGGSARDHPDVKGLPGSRAASWVSYAGAWVSGLVLVALGVNGVRPWTGLITATMVLGGFGLFMMANDAGASAKQARAVAAGIPTVGWQVRPLIFAGENQQWGRFGLVGVEVGRR